MAPSSGHMLVPKALRIFKFAVSQARSLVRAEVPTGLRTQRSVHTQVPKHVSSHSTAIVKEARVHSSTASAPVAKSRAPRRLRSAQPTSPVSRAANSKGAGPFASTLRPCLTGGALPRTAGGYSIGGRARHFSHASACQAQVLQNVSAGVRAFFVNGSKARFDGVDPVTREKKWRAISQAEDRVHQSWEGRKTASYQSSKQMGTSLDFHISPTITALLPQSASEADAPISLQTSTVLPTLSKDFARALQEMSSIYHDLDLLSRFGALPINLIQDAKSGPILRVRFPGCDGQMVSALCDEVGVKRGVVREDEAWSDDSNREVEMALLFPFAPTSTFGVDSPRSVLSEDIGVEEYFTRPQHSHTPMNDLGTPTPSTTSFSSLAGYTPSPTSTPPLASTDPLSTTPPSAPLSTASLSMSTILDAHPNLANTDLDITSPLSPPLADEDPHHHDHRPSAASTASTEDYEGVEGIYRFLQECDDAVARRRPR